MASPEKELLAEFTRDFKELQKLFAARDIVKLKHLGADTARDSLEFNEPRFVEFSVVAYSLSKLLEKPYIVESKKWKKFSQFLNDQLTTGVKCATKDQCDLVLTKIVAEVDKLSESLGRFVTSVIEKARIKAATQIYAHGASISRAIELTNADRKELLSYIGNTKLSDKYATKSVKERLAFGEKLFK